jgi:hypothetical protein
MCLGAILPGSVSQLDGQAAERRLAAPDAAFPEAFSSVSGFRELPDGRVMIADGLGQALVVADMAAGRADTLGRVGQGPAEYRQPDGLFALPGDSTLLVDLGNGRLTVIGPDGSFGETAPIAQGEPGPRGGMVFVLPRGVDSQGRVYFQSGFGGMGRGEQPPDSTPIMRWDRATGAIDTLAQVKLPGRNVTRGGRGNERMVRMLPIPMSPQDDWAVGRDGRVALVRSADYHVEWIQSEGRSVRGSVNRYRPVTIGQAEKEVWMEQLAASGLSISVSIENGRRSMTFGRCRGGRQTPVDEYQWPDAMPAFRAGGTWVTPDGHVWVERYTEAGADPVFDVFDADAEFVEQVIFPTGARVVGFGRGAVYVVRSDEFDLQWLERYRLAVS